MKKWAAQGADWTVSEDTLSFMNTYTERRLPATNSTNNTGSLSHGTPVASSRLGGALLKRCTAFAPFRACRKQP